MICNRIKMLRVAAGMTQEQLGEILGVGKATVQKYESGQIQNLKTSHIRTLCEIFNKKPHYFIFDDLERFEKPDNQLIENLSSVHDKLTADGYKHFLKLNEAGRKKVIEYTFDLSQIPKYTRD